MGNDNLKIQLDSIQRILSYCITQTYNVLIGNILRKKNCISNIQFKHFLQKEYIRVTDELSSIYLNSPALACVEEYYNDDDFLWESSFFESLTKWKSHTNLTHPGKYFRPSKVKIMRPTSPK